MTEYPNWFEPYARPMFEKHLLPLAGTPGLRFLQLGAFTGDASVWLMENVLTSDFELGPNGMGLTGEPSYLYDVDTWEGSDEPEHEPFDWSDVERVYDAKIAPHHRVAKHKMTSADYFADGFHAPYDFIYVDADHTPFGVLNDAVDAYRVLKVGGLLAFDDYQWTSHKTGVGPALAIDGIDDCYRGRLQPIQLGAQAWFRKIA